MGGPEPPFFCDASRVVHCLTTFILLIMPHFADDTIAAIATAPGLGGLCVVRISGPGAFVVADRIFKGKVRSSRCKSHTVHYGMVVDPLTGSVVDEVLMSVLRAPRTYTCENTVEFSGHGGVLPGNGILTVALDNGARLADPGEFTKRAFLNGRLDLAQAEAVSQLIQAKTAAGARAAVLQLNGGLSAEIVSFRDRLLTVLSLVEVGLDFVEEDIDAISPLRLVGLLRVFLTDLDGFIVRSLRSRLFERGARIGIVGVPNAGKSSILNSLLGRSRAIVDESPGTTRDTIEGVLDLGGIPVTLVDTAGIRESEESVEANGILRTREEMVSADFLLWIVDRSLSFEVQWEMVGLFVDPDRTIVVLNKSDLGSEHILEIPDGFRRRVETIAISDSGTEQLRLELNVLVRGIELIWEDSLFVSSRQMRHLNGARNAIDRAILLLGVHHSGELVAIEVMDGLKQLGSIIGLDVGDDVLDRIFASFCIGK